MNPFEAFEQQRQQLIDKYIEQCNRDVKRVRLILNVIIVLNVGVAVAVPIILWLFTK